MKIEEMGIPTVVNTCTGFDLQAEAVLGLSPFPYVPVVTYPWHIDAVDIETREKAISELVAPGNEKALTTQIELGELAGEAPETEPVVFPYSTAATLDQIHDFYHEKLWTDGLPIIPPTKEKIEEFLKFTDYPADTVLGPPIQPSFRVATPWTVAVNGVMAGCRPEYMPVLMAITQIMHDPVFGTKDIGSTPGTSLQPILSGPIIKQLGFNTNECVFRPGFQANTSVGRFYQLLLRTVPQMTAEFTDKATFGHGFRNVLPENEDACKELGWEPVSVDLGFEAGDNVMTMVGIASDTYGWPACAAELLYPGPFNLPGEENTIKTIGHVFKGTSYYSQSITNTTLVVISPMIAGMLAPLYSKDDIKQLLFDKYARVPAKDVDWNKWIYARPDTLCSDVEAGILPELYCESDDPERMVPLFSSFEQLQIIVAGDPNRNRFMVLCQAHPGHGKRTSRKIELPKNWDALLAEAKKK